jgi:hypothetical protein
MTQRLACHVSGPEPGAPGALPEDDDHPFWRALDALADDVQALRNSAGVTDQRHSEGVMTISSDAPVGWHYCWIDIPDTPALRDRMLALSLEGFSRARLALPEASWELLLEDRLLDWTGDRFESPA